jgi:hypothetical protein
VNGHPAKRVGRGQVMMALGQWAELAELMEAKGCPQEAAKVRGEVRRLAEWMKGED